MRRLEVEQVRRPRAGDERTPQAPGRGRTPPGHTRVPCEELADGKTCRPGRTPVRHGTVKSPKARTGPRPTPDGAPRGATRPKDA